MIKDLHKKLEVIELLEEFKYIKRAMFCPKDLENRENDAEHSWHLAMMAIILHDEYDYLDLKKLLIFALIHDLPEIYAGDVPIHEISKREGKKEREEKAIEKLLSKMDENNSKNFQEWFDEYENKKSKEARFIYQLDKIHPMMISTMCKGKTWKFYKMDKTWLIDNKLSKVDEEFGLKEILMHYINKAEDNEFFYEENEDNQETAITSKP